MEKNLDHSSLSIVFAIRKAPKCSPEASDLEVMDLTKRPDIILGLQDHVGLMGGSYRVMVTMVSRRVQ